MFDIIIILIFAIAALVKSADYFVVYSSKIAKKVGVSELVIGLTLVSLGTSLPELVSSLIASIRGNTDLVVGNILGSNVANIGLILAIGVIIAKTRITKKMYHVDGFIMVGTALLFTLLVRTDFEVDFFEGLILLGLYIAYIFYLFKTSLKRDIDYQKHLQKIFSYQSFEHIIRLLTRLRKKIYTSKEKFQDTLLFDFLVVALSGVGIYLGAKFTVDYSIRFAEILNVPESFIGFTALALGTSLPELSVTISSARKGFGDIILGNIIGSNIANILLVGGASALFNPLEYTNPTLIIAMLVITFLLFIFMRTKWKIEKWEGFVMLALYFLVIIYLFIAI
jgi:cation:H+ antiporter